MIRAAWLVVAVTSGFLQLILIVCGGLFLSDQYDWKLIRTVALVAGFWSLFWPIYVYLGMNHSYRALLEEQRIRIKDQQNKPCEATRDDAPN